MFNKIEVLSPDEFKESLVGELKPSKNSMFKGIHTFSKNKESLMLILKPTNIFLLQDLLLY